MEQSTAIEVDVAVLVKGILKSFEGPKGATNKVLKGVDFGVKRGEIFALLGSNGAGKTTIINILSTLMKSDGGTALVNNFDVAKEPGKVRQSISLTGQFAAVDDILTGRENLILIAKLRSVANPAKVADELLERFGLTEAANRRVSTYSGGMTRRLDIAMSLIGKPAVIFLDEPTTGLDPEGRHEVWKTIKELADGGTTILLTTHYLDEAEELADKMAILHGGTIIAQGSLGELKKLFPPAKVEYVEKQPSLEDIFLAIIGRKADLNASRNADPNAGTNTSSNVRSDTDQNANRKAGN
jgi:ABC-2 type transport system ATP-binding protein